ncbi:DUF3558 family protein [Amycolatopsis rhizosphaerae]|uniref:DUF3558 family protein n=1 Tax=Amycolatopsis rhizosphaerae TaxID=2053003 RepID=UPI0016439C51|nr:DUF3558 family protein [Amycolatopsis rhizosphaerae]
MRSVALSTIVAAAALTAVACSSTQSGQPLPMNGQTPTSSARPSSTGTAATGSKLSGLNACALLADGEAQQIVPGAGIHVDQGELGGIGTSNCRWSKSVTNGQGGVTFGLTVRPAQSVKDVVVQSGGQLSSTTSTGGRQVALVKNNGAGISCFAAIAVGSGRVDIDVTTVRGATAEDMCAIVSKIDDVVEPRLPTS